MVQLTQDQFCQDNDQTIMGPLVWIERRNDKTTLGQLDRTMNAHKVNHGTICWEETEIILGPCHKILLQGKVTYRVRHFHVYECIKIKLIITDNTNPTLNTLGSSRWYTKAHARFTLDPMYDEGCPHRIADKSNCDLRPE